LHDRQRDSLAASTPLSQHFDGLFLPATSTFLTPPDTIADVGHAHYVQMVNSQYGARLQIFDKNGRDLSGPVEFRDLWPAGTPGHDLGGGDPVVLYDRLAGRWFLSQFAFVNLPTPPPPWYLCIAISQTGDPLGAYYLYTFTVSDYFPDYPKYGVWPDAYCLSTNDGPPRVGTYALDRKAMLQGQTAAGIIKFANAQANFMLPCTFDGYQQPPIGSPSYFYTMMDDVFWPGNGFPGVCRLEIWAMYLDFTKTADSAFVHLQDIPITPFLYTVAGYFNLGAIPQRGTDASVDAVSEWPMWRFPYYNFGSYEVLLGNFTVDVDNSDHAGLRWFELRKSGNGPWALYQEGTHASDAHHRFMGSIAMNNNGDIAIGYAISSSTLYPSIRYAVQLAGDPLGTLRSEATIYDGSYSQTASDRWGDYSAMSSDPAGGVAFWYTNEYIGSNGRWRTHIGTIGATGQESRTSSGGNRSCGASGAEFLLFFLGLVLMRSRRRLR
jgi:hypothetical protein